MYRATGYSRDQNVNHHSHNNAQNYINGAQGYNRLGQSGAQGHTQFAHSGAQAYNTVQSRSEPCKCCGMLGHAKQECRHRYKECSGCIKKGHLRKVCHANAFNGQSYVNPR